MTSPAAPATPPADEQESFLRDKAELLALMHAEGICRSSETQVILDSDGSPVRWTLDSLGVSLKPRGAELAGRCLLHLLRRFEGRQIATFGVTAIPLLQSCVLLSGGRYRGLLVRKEVKKYGTLKRIEGQLDPGEPVIVLDDTIAGGSSFAQCRQYLEAAGLRVEGLVCLVRFGWNSAFSRLQEEGLHTESVFDIKTDFVAPLDGPPIRYDPESILESTGWSDHAAPEGLHPAQLARLTIEEYLRSGRVLRPPERVEGDWDGSGGVLVSLRSRSDIQRRYARDGFWRLPGDPRFPLPREIILSALRAGRQLPAGEPGRKLLAESGIALTFFSALEPCTVGQLDNERYGLLVRSAERPLAMGGALPRMPGFASEWRQFHHARFNNAHLTPTEPFLLYRHGVQKCVEPGVVWQPSGVPAPEGPKWEDDPTIGGRAALRARDLVLAHLTGAKETTEPLPKDLLPPSVDMLFVSVYFAGQVRGCIGAYLSAGDLDTELRKAAQAALADDRFRPQSGPMGPAELAVKVSILYAPVELGAISPEEAAKQVRIGQQALMAYQGQRSAIMLPEVVAEEGMTPEGFVKSVLHKGGLTQPPYRWTCFDATAWLADADGPRRMDGAFPAAEPVELPLEQRLRRMGGLFVGYLQRHHRDDGRLLGEYAPFSDTAKEGQDLPRLAHGGWVLARAARVTGDEALAKVARATVGHVLSRARPDEYGRLWLGERTLASIAEVAFLLLAIAELPDEADLQRAAPQWATTLWTSIDSHGRFATHRLPASSAEAYQDYFPGQALLALGRAAQQELTQVDEERLSRALSYYRHRFRYKRDWGQVCWLPQALAAWWWKRRDPVFAELAFEIVDWALPYQQEKTGGFINDHQPDAPGYTTVLYLEAIAAALRVAQAMGDDARAERYRAACENGWRFMDRIVYQERDAAILPNIEWALGGVRISPINGTVRTDFVQHALNAVMELQAALAGEVPEGAAEATGAAKAG